MSFIKSRLVQAPIPRGRTARAVAALAFGGLVTAACGDATGPETLTTLTIAPLTATVQGNGTVQFTAAGTRSGSPITTLEGETWSVSGGGTISTSGLFTAGTTAGTHTITVACGGLTATATVTVTPGPLATITVSPNPATLVIGTQQQFTAVGRDAFGNVVPITPVWSTTDPPGTINSSTGLFTAGTTTGTFNNGVTATQGSLSGTAIVIVTAPPPPASTFRVLADVAVTCTNGSITGDVGTFQAAPTGSITQTICPITGGTAQVGTPAAVQAYNDFVTAFDARAPVPCGTVLTGTLAGVALAPGVYCFDAAATLTGTLTLDGPSTGVWLFKIGTSGVGALTGTNFSVVMAGGASPCNVTWWVRDAATITDTDLKGAILAGADITTTRGTLKGNAWSQGDVTITGTVLTACDAP
jgi:Ice-binding-like